MIDAKMVKPRWFSWNSSRQPEQVNRLQEISGDLTLNRDKVYEIGRVDLLDFRKKTPSLAGKFRQFENGSMSTWYALANKVNPGSGDPHYIELTDLMTTMTDFSAYETDDDNIFTGSIWFPKLRVNSFTINIGDPEAILERNLNLISESSIILPDAYFAYADKVTSAHSGDAPDTIHFGASGEAPLPIAYAASSYIFRVLRIRGGQVSVLLEDETLSPAADTWAYDNATKTVTIQSTETGDVHKVYYESATAYSNVWTDNNSEATILLAEYCEVYIKVGTAERIFRLQSVGIDVTFDRTDYKEIGNNEVVQTGVKGQTVKISLNRFTQGFSFEEMLANDTIYPYINPDDFADDIQVQVKVFGEKEHTNFRIGYLMNKVSPTAVGSSQMVQDKNKSTTTLEGDNLRISDLESEISFA